MGHSTSSGRTSTTERAVSTEHTTDRERARQAVANDRTLARQLAREIDRRAFTNEGFGNWQLDIEGIGGGQVLDETGSSRDIAYGRGGKVYSIRAWDADYNGIGETTMVYGSLNEAKRSLREMLHRHYGTRG